MPTIPRRATVSEDHGNAFSWRFVAPLLAGSSVNAINSSLIATALVPIAVTMHVSAGRATVLVAVLYLASAVAQPTGGTNWPRSSVPGGSSWPAPWSCSSAGSLAGLARIWLP